MTVGLLLSAKMSGVLVAFVVPLMLLAAPFYWRSRSDSMIFTFLRAVFLLVLCAVLSVVVLWAMYGFRYSAFAREDDVVQVGLAKACVLFLITFIIVASRLSRCSSSDGPCSQMGC